MNELAIFLRERRKDEALTQVEMAKKIGITSITLSNIENGKPIGSNVLKKLSKYLNISTRDIRALSKLEVENNK